MTYEHKPTKKTVEVPSASLTENVILADDSEKEFMYIGNKLYRVSDIQAVLDGRIPEVVEEAGK
jgi:hypothetical protein